MFGTDSAPVSVTATPHQPQDVYAAMHWKVAEMAAVDSENAIQTHGTVHFVAAAPPALADTEAPIVTLGGNSQSQTPQEAEASPGSTPTGSVVTSPTCTSRRAIVSLIEPGGPIFM